MIQIPSRTETELKLNLLKTNKKKETNPPECIKKTKNEKYGKPTKYITLIHFTK